MEVETDLAFVKPDISATEVDPIVVVEPSSSSSGPAVASTSPPAPVEKKKRSKPVYSLEESVEIAQSALQSNVEDGLGTVVYKGLYLVASNGFPWVMGDLSSVKDPSLSASMLRLAVACALVVCDFSNLSGGDFGRCSNELLATWYHTILSRQSVNSLGNMFLSAKQMYNLCTIDSLLDGRRVCVQGGKFASRHSDTHIGTNAISDVRKTVRLSVVGDSGLLTFPYKAVGKGRII